MSEDNIFLIKQHSELLIIFLKNLKNSRILIIWPSSYDDFTLFFFNNVEEIKLSGVCV